MKTSRLEAFSDGVIAIIITIMVLELQAPHGAGSRRSAASPAGVPELRSELRATWGSTGTITITCCMLTDRVTGRILWANLHLLFWLSLVPFTTGWMGENHFAALPTAVYGLVLLMASIAYWILVRAIIAGQGRQSKLAQAVGRDFKGMISTAIYAVAIPLAFVHQAIADALYVTVVLLWLVPDRRIESRLAD